MKENFLVDLSKQFAVDIVNLYTYIKENRKSNVLLNQVLRSGTSIGLTYMRAIMRQAKRTLSCLLLPSPPRKEIKIYG